MDKKNSVDDLCIQFFDNGEDKESLTYAKKLEAMGYRVWYTPTSGASALAVNDYEVAGPSAIAELVKQLQKR